ncbi:MAG: hypothetical protein AMXMBFR7_17770 [Planctomycetota bacterium]
MPIVHRTRVRMTIASLFQSRSDSPSVTGAWFIKTYASAACARGGAWCGAAKAFKRRAVLELDENLELCVGRTPRPHVADSGTRAVAISATLSRLPTKKAPPDGRGL